MTALNAKQVRDMLSDDFDDEYSLDSCDDSCDEDEVDFFAVRIDPEEEAEQEEEELVEVENEEVHESVMKVSNVLFKLPGVIQPNFVIPTLSPSESVEMIYNSFPLPHVSFSLLQMISGRQNTKKTNNVFDWYSKPNNIDPPIPDVQTRVFRQILKTTTIESFFKLIITPEMVQEIADHTNRRIKLIDLTQIVNEKYKSEKERLNKKEITSEDLYAFIGILILLGITKTSNVSVEKLWSKDSIHFAPFAMTVLSRNRFNLIARNITFDDISNYF